VFVVSIMLENKKIMQDMNSILLASSNKRLHHQAGQQAAVLWYVFRFAKSIIHRTISQHSRSFIATSSIGVVMPNHLLLSSPR
jgi:hypothetical protein